jgi:hypothetical protein
MKRFMYTALAALWLVGTPIAGMAQTEGQSGTMKEQSTTKKHHKTKKTHKKTKSKGSKKKATSETTEAR